MRLNVYKEPHNLAILLYEGEQQFDVATIRPPDKLPAFWCLVKARYIKPLLDAGVIEKTGIKHPIGKMMYRLKNGFAIGET